MRAQTKEEWERELVDVIGDTIRKDAADPAEALRLALGAKGVLNLHVVWKKLTNEGRHLPLSAEGRVTDVAGSEHDFSAWFNVDPFIFRWIG